MNELYNCISVALLGIGLVQGADFIQKQGLPTPITTVPGFAHIFWQKVAYSQGDCSVDLEAIFYWSPTFANVSNQGDEYYTPGMFIHGGGWSGSATFNPPTTVATAQAIAKWTSLGYMYMQPTYRGASDIVANPAIGNCDHPRELIKDAEFIVQAIHNRHAEIPVGLRVGEKIRVSGGSAGGLVGMSLAVNHPEWFERASFAVGVYDLSDLRANWEVYLSNFADRNLAECVLDLGDKFSARTAGNQPWFKTNAGANCAKIANPLSTLSIPRAYRITDVEDGDWAEVSDGFFTVEFQNLGIWGTLTLSVFDDNGSVVASSNGDATMPVFDKVIIQEITAGSVPVLSAAQVKAKLENSTGTLMENALHNFLNEPFLSLPANAPILLENSYGEVLKSSSTGDYPPFLLGTNTGDFVLQEQAISFCNDVQESENLAVNEILSLHVKGVVYQCGDRGTLIIDTGGNHFAGTPHGTSQEEAYWEWLVHGYGAASHTVKKAAEVCSFSIEKNKFKDWITKSNANEDNYRALFDGHILGNGDYDINGHYYSEWDAIQNDPLYFGSDADSYPWVLSIYGLNQVWLASPGPLEVDAGIYGRHHQICLRPLI